MIVAITGAFRNVGDHLIGFRGKQLLTKFVDKDVVEINRKNISHETYELFNRARYVFLCGGPAYQTKMFPDVYPLDLTRISTPVVPFGLGWKGKLNLRPDQSVFSPHSIECLRQIHAKTVFSSARDEMTKSALKAHGIENVLMTGCPATYDLDKMEQPFSVPKEFKRIVLSTPALIDGNTFKLVRFLRKRFPSGELTLSFHHGVWPRRPIRSFRSTWNYPILAAYASRFGYRIDSMEADVGEMLRVYDNIDLHIGYRVHAHLYCVSQRTPTLLISEDSRGVGQNTVLGLNNFLADDPEMIEKIGAELDALEQSGEKHFEESLSRISDNFTAMKSFFQSL